MPNPASTHPPVVVAGGGIGGLATALALAQAGWPSIVLEQSAQFGEIGAGIQLGPNAFHVFDRLGVNELVKRQAVFIEKLVLMDSLDGEPVIDIPVGEAFRARFGNPYAVIHRADIHGALYEACVASPLVTLRAKAKVTGFETTARGVDVVLDGAERVSGAALVGADGLHSKVRAAVVGDGAPRVSGHVTYRAVLPVEQMPEELRWPAATLWAGPNTHLVHYPLRGWKLFNIVATFHAHATEAVSNAPGDRDEILHAFRLVCDKPRKILETPHEWRKWVLCDRVPVENWSQGPVTLLGDAAHPMLQYMAQGACMALEDAVVLADEVKRSDGDFAAAFRAYQDKRITRTGRVVLSARMMGHLFHAKGVERLVRNDMYRGRSPQSYYDSLAWLYDPPFIRA